MLLVQLLTLASVCSCAQILLPELTGPHHIGLTHLELIDYNRPDARDLMVTFFYPTPNTSSRPLGPQFSPATAAYIDKSLSLSPGTAAALTTRAQLDAPIADPYTAPVILFSHGFGFVRGLYSSLLSDLASWGWVVAAVDHPHDAALVEYPDGRVALARNWSWPLDPRVREAALEARVEDLLFVLGQMGDAEVMAQIPSMRPGLADGEGVLRLQCRARGLRTTAFNVPSVAVLGHSFGGATAVQALMDAPAVVAAADLDGFLYGPVVQSGTDKPVLVLGFPEHFATDDPDAAPGWPSLRGWKRDFTVDGTVHESYSDYSVLADILGAQGPEAGTVPGARTVEITRTYLDAFYHKFLLGVDDEGVLSGNCSTFTEVALRRSKG
ncbi:Uu.00g025070.m01.CDS01 [Anthostomella pinea]|uniref:1-alkyl-2-acetylglycerophosphocholine esterase n=1 Tax=Anthostomella pinea TaxID=933095 RepID=A0AAI8V787_9PEZI|nr:Uu.00g025070.m01.CDS01 [Anthostomella pinea]